MARRTRLRGRFGGLLIGAMLLGQMPAAARAEILVFAAASLKNALDEADTAYRHEAGVKVVASYAASGALAKQIQNGAPADLFISADEKWMDVLARQGLILVDSRRDVLGNRLVLIAPAGDRTIIDLATAVDLRARLSDGRLAIGDPAYVPAGAYTESALRALGLWDAVKDRLAPTENVRGALALVGRGEAPLGVVYATDVAADSRVRVAAMFPESSHPPILYPIALTRTGDRPAARAYLEWLCSAGLEFFRKQGFTAVPPN